MYDSHPSLRSLVLVEDSGDDERLSIRAISKSGVGCRTEVIRHGGEAIFLLLSPGWPTPGLIVLDYHLPGANGLEILRELRSHEKFRLVPIVMFSSLGNDQNVMECMLEGANSFVQKPVDPIAYTEYLASMVRYWMIIHRSTVHTQVLESASIES